jgi:hypothetical protein
LDRGAFARKRSAFLGCAELQQAVPLYWRFDPLS